MSETKEEREIEQFIIALEQALPPIFARHSLSELTGRLINGNSIANLSSLGIGPPGGVRIGRKVAFSREIFIAWIRTNKLKNIR